MVGSGNSIYDDFFDERATNSVAFLGYTILVWDHIITFGDEVRLVWLKKKSAITYLFLFNRYFTPLSFIGNLIAYFSHWSPSFLRCQSFVRYEGSCTVIAIEVTALMMLVRIYALYKTRKIVVFFVLSILLAETGVNSWLLTHGQAVQHGPGVHACTMIFDPNLHFLPSLSAWIPLAYDTIAIVLTLYRCLGPIKQKTAGHIVRTLLKDGLIYYSVIFVINFILAIMIVSTPPGVKNITAQLEQLLTVAMMSRITLNLKREAERPVDPDDYLDCFSVPASTTTGTSGNNSSKRLSTSETALFEENATCFSTIRASVGLRNSFSNTRRHSTGIPRKSGFLDGSWKNDSHALEANLAMPEQAVISDHDQDIHELRNFRTTRKTPIR